MILIVGGGAVAVLCLLLILRFAWSKRPMIAKVGLLGSNELTRRLLRNAKRHFAAQSWAILLPADPLGDFDVSKGELYFAVKCTDRNTRHFMSETQILEQFEALSRRFRLKNKTLIHIMDFELSNASFPKLHMEGIAAIPVDHLQQVTEVEFLLQRPMSGNNPLADLLLQGNQTACLSASDTFARAGDVQGAVAWAYRAVNGRTGFSSAYHKLLDLLMKHGDLNGAEELGERALSFRPTDMTFLRTLQRNAVKRGDFPRALTLAQRMVKCAPTDVTTYDTIADVLVRSSDFGAAREMALAAHELEPDNPVILRKLSIIAEKTEDWPDAVRWATRLIAIAPRDAVSRETLVGLLMKQGDYVRATEAASDAFKIFPDNVVIIRRLARCLEAVGDLDGAVSTIQRLLVIMPDDGPGHDAHAGLRLKQQDYAAASDAIGQAIRMDPQNPIFFKKAAIIALASKDYDSALSFGKLLVALKGDDALSHDLLATIYLRREDFVAASAAAREACRLDPDSAVFHRKAEQISRLGAARLLGTR